jgi:hypothetical protein
MSNQCREPRDAGHGKALAGMIGGNSTAATGLKPRGTPRSRRSRIGVGQQGEQGRLKVASRRRALRLGAAIVFEFEQGKLSCLFGLPRRKLLAAQQAKLLPAKGVAIDDDGVGLGHGTSRGFRLGGFRQ